MDRLEVAARLDEIAARIRLTGGQAHRARAYHRAARTLEASGYDLERLVDEQKLTSLPHVGPALAGVIGELVRTGKSGLLERLRAELPRAVVELSQVVTPKRARALVDQLGVQSVAELRAAAEAGRVRELPGFGAKTEASIVKAIQRWQRGSERVRLVDARAVAEPLLDYLQSAGANADLAGAARRGHEIVGGVHIVASGADPRALARQVERYPLLISPVSAKGRITGATPRGVRVEVDVVCPSEHARALLEATGSEEHVSQLVRRASGALPDAESEERVYAAIGLAWVPPELRDDPHPTLAGRSLPRLVSQRDVVGMVHCHTDWSDGKHDIETMARAAEAMGMQYLTITDHSPAAHYAGGLSVERLQAQWEEIARVQELVNVQLLRGTECDILADGSLDYPDWVLENLDVVIASVHTRFKMGADDMTRRLTRAMRLPWFKIWGHGLGRLLLRRDPIECDVLRVLDAAAESPAAIEINGDPYRLDLAPEWLREARSRDIPCVISTDAHSTRGMQNLGYAVTLARRAGLPPEAILNTRPAAEFVRAVRPARERREVTRREALPRSDEISTG